MTETTIQEAETEISTETTASETEESQSLISEESTETETEAKAEAEPFVPLTSEDLTFAEGTEISEESRDTFLATLNKLGTGDLSVADAAQQLVDLQTNLATTAAESLAQAWEQTQEDWRAQSLAHPDFGGEKLKPALADIELMINEVAGDTASDVYEALSLTGACNHPAIISLMAKLSKDYKEAHPAPGSVTDPPRDLASQMFPNQGRT